MSGSSLKLFALALALVSVATASTIKDEETLRKLSNYREWARVTQKPFRIDASSLAG